MPSLILFVFAGADMPGYVRVRSIQLLFCVVIEAGGVRSGLDGLSLRGAMAIAPREGVAIPHAR